MPTTRMTGSQRRQQLITVGRALFAERGYQAATVEEIADRAGVTKPVVYEHFGGKDGLYAVVVDREIDELSARMTAAISTDKARVAGEQAALAFLTYIDERGDGFRVLVRDAPAGRPEGALATVMGDVAVRVEQLLEENFADRGFDAEAAPMYARMLIGAVAFVGEWWLESGRPDRDRMASHVVNLLWNGLQGLESEPQPLRILAGPEHRPDPTASAGGDGDAADGPVDRVAEVD